MARDGGRRIRIWPPRRDERSGFLTGARGRMGQARMSLHALAAGVVVVVLVVVVVVVVVETGA